jgi:hypothetical protein
MAQDGCPEPGGCADLHHSGSVLAGCRRMAGRPSRARDAAAHMPAPASRVGGKTRSPDATRPARSLPMRQRGCRFRPPPLQLPTAPLPAPQREPPPPPPSSFPRSSFSSSFSSSSGLQSGRSAPLTVSAPRPRPPCAAAGGGPPARPASPHSGGHWAAGWGWGVSGRGGPSRAPCAGRGPTAQRGWAAILRWPPAGEGPRRDPAANWDVTGRGLCKPPPPPLSPAPSPGLLLSPTWCWRCPLSPFVPLCGVFGGVPIPGGPPPRSPSRVGRDRRCGGPDFASVAGEPRSRPHLLSKGLCRSAFQVPLLSPPPANWTPNNLSVAGFA